MSMRRDEPSFPPMYQALVFGFAMGVGSGFFWRSILDWLGIIS